MEEQTLIFITGGARSGKSTFAEKIVSNLSSDCGGNLHYIASCKPLDHEMKNRINLHKKQREESGVHWKTWECPLDLRSIAPSFQTGDIVLLDCLTILLSNELFRDRYLESSWNNKEHQELVIQSILKGIDDIRENSKALVIVSNEVLNEQIIDRSLVQTYGRLLGYLHQQFVKKASRAYVVEAGIPVLMKGGSVR
ncbi:bifunctional adenosylcobinamide kinase/adenosylcobinamide-phosphate guanylyltransferase [Neobacillus sp. PS3-40]|uniref:bifunctional adenosylcobinamide kinase/adenosylcobinamide-phosphate guanylyltransferase n=1 Tax=Neobacillus sp. PS3-40 TaxID=3070679 RepID=UPI0027E1B338|nr:bifunctional adenosylcobinamide kinase/adenosylcobinamide-phosphate guanylyltransferase [Neobacillus sp. PS3-40]WML43032.1 bifunctional adenosylcobinamide kinase/adenosylcobinamide-phosphate guanylyltransferase [Neobacillus sp. PS3-40]